MADRRLQVFHAVAKHLSFTRAAETLFMTQPAVTFQIKQLEEHLNTRLFDRAQGRIALTPAGQLAFDYAERILALSNELDTRLKEMSGQAAGPLLIGASMTIGEYVLPQLIGQFKARFPAVVPALYVGNSEAVQERVAERTLDLGFIESGCRSPRCRAKCAARTSSRWCARPPMRWRRSPSRCPPRSRSIPTSAARRARGRAR
jgi:DNA-binding transcriptional LysR family regulator